MGVLVKVSSVVQAGEERTYLAYTSTALFIIKGSQDNNSNRSGTWQEELIQSPWRDAIYLLAHHGCLASSFYRI